MDCTFNIKRALVTGGAGFIGSHIVERLLAEGSSVVVLDDLSTGVRENVHEAADFILGSVANSLAVQKALRAVDVVFHLAAVSSVQDSLARPLDVHDCNLSSTLLLLEAARTHGVKRFIFSSSAAVYGDTWGVPAREDMKPKPLSHYAVQKLACEHYCDVYRRLYGLQTFCLRYFNVFGARQRADSPYSGVIARFLLKAKQGESLVIFGDGSQSRDFCPVANVVSANIAAARLPREDLCQAVFNVGTGTSVTVKRLASLIAQAVGGSEDFEYTAAKSGEVSFSQADLRYSINTLGYTPTHTFETSLTHLCNIP
jgi:nucleoside-diphosphate-sugar epimerase